MTDINYNKIYIECYNLVIDIVEIVKELLYFDEYTFERLDESLSLEEQIALIKKDLESMNFEKEIPHYFVEMLEYFFPSAEEDLSYIGFNANNFKDSLIKIKSKLTEKYIPFIKIAEIRRYQNENNEEIYSDEDAWNSLLSSQYEIEDIENTINDIIWALYRNSTDEIIDVSLQDRYKLNDIEFTRYMVGYENDHSSIKRIEKNKEGLNVNFKKFNKYFQDIYGQDETIEKIRKTLLRNILFYNAKDITEGKEIRNKGPLATFMFYGPTGTGKTETAKLMAKFVFGNDKKLLILDMNSYKDSKVASSALKGHPEGYVDSAKGTDFTRFLQKNDKGIIVLDEFEKASIEVRELFMTMLDEGNFKDALGNTYDLSGYIFVATTNVSSVFENRPKKIGFSSSCSIEEKKDEESRVKDELRNIFTAPIINRFNDVLGFNEIKKKDAIIICKSLISKLISKFESKVFDGINPKIKIDNIDEIVEIILKESNFKKDGVRSLKNVINDLIGSQVLEEIVNGEDKILVSAVNGRIILKNKIGLNTNGVENSIKKV